MGSDRDYTAAIYGSLLVTALVAVQSEFGASAVFVAGSLIVSVAVFWLTHAWSAIVNERVRGPISQWTALRLAVDESPMLIAVIVPATLLALAHFGVYSVDTAVSLALVTSLLQLFLWGLVVGRAASDSWPVSLVIATVDFGLGLIIVVVKLVVLH